MPENAAANPDQPPPTLWQSLTNPSSNPLLSTGLSLLIFGSILTIGRKGFTQAAALAQRRMLVSLEIPSRDRSHAWLLQWMEEQSIKAQKQQGINGGSPSSSSKEIWQDALEVLGLRNGPPRPVKIVSRDLAAVTSIANSAERSTAEVEAQAFAHGGPLPGNTALNKPSKASISLVPGPGTHYFRYQGTWIKMTRERNGKLLDVTTGSPWETLTLTTLYRSRSVFSRLLSEAEGLASTKAEGKTTIYTAWGLEWRAFGNARKTRQLDSVVLTRGQRDRVVSDISAFLSRGQWYARRGIPYRRGYLFHGSPGSGKTSMVQALAGEMDLNICLLNLSERGLTDDRLTHLLSMAPERSVLLLEDIDAAFPSRLAHSGRAEADGQSAASGSQSSGSSSSAPPVREYQTSVTFSGLLNALDGVASGESRIVVMTTNHVERLDPALIRPGRVDLIEELGDADPGMVRDLFDRFYSASGAIASSNSRVDLTAHKDPSPPHPDAARRGTDRDGVDGDQGMTDPFAVPALSPQVFAELSDRLADAVSLVSRLRRQELGLDDSGRFRRSQSPGSNIPTTSEGGAQGRLSVGESDPSAGVSTTASTAPVAVSPPEASTLHRTKAKTLPAARGGVSMAELQGLFIRYPLDPLGAVVEMEKEAQTAPREQHANESA
ncbi:unnamed protein product [Parajaminaea phylloscopi]